MPYLVQQCAAVTDMGDNDHNCKPMLIWRFMNVLPTLSIKEASPLMARPPACFVAAMGTALLE